MFLHHAAHERAMFNQSAMATTMRVRKVAAIKNEFIVTMPMIASIITAAFLFGTLAMYALQRMF